MQRATAAALLGGATPGSVFGAGGAAALAAAAGAPTIPFAEFCQLADMQFLTHIRRGTSISAVDLAPSAAPTDLPAALVLLTITSEL